MMSRTQSAGATPSRPIAVALCSLAAVLCAPAARAQGFGLNEIGSCAIARGFAATGAPCDDVSTLYWNPGAATTLRGLSIYGGASAIAVKGRFTADSTGCVSDGDVPTEFPPFFGVNWTPASHRWAVGLAAYVPYGLTSQWKPDFAGRFSAQKASLASVYVQPNVAFELVPGKLSIGGGPTFGWSRLELRQSIDLAPQTAQRVGTTGISFAQLGVAPLTEFAQVRLGGSATRVGFDLGAYARLTPTLSVGARYLSKVRFDYRRVDATFRQVSTGLQIFPGSPLRASLPAGTPATAVVPLDAVLATQFAAGGLLAPGQQASTHIDFPAQLQIGVGYTGFASTTLSLDYGMVQWRSFAELPVDFGATSPLTRTLIERYRNASSVRAGVDHRFGAIPLGGLLDGVRGRLGFAYAQTPAPDETVTPLLPDMSRYNFMAGVGVPLTPALSLDAAYLRVETAGRRGRVIERTATQTAAQVNGGFYDLNANILSLSLRAQF